MSITRRRLLATSLNISAISLGCAIAPKWAGANDSNWKEIERVARGQRVLFNAWGGSSNVNAYLQWVAGEMERSHGIRLEHVKVTDTVDVVRRVRTEKAAGKSTNGSVDLVWINGENFLAMKREQLLAAPWVDSLPNGKYVDWEGKPTTRLDFAEPVSGLEAPWGMAQFTLYADRVKVANPPRSTEQLLAFARANPGRFSYPKPPNFHGTTFLKQTLLDLLPTSQRAILYRPYDAGQFETTTLALWAHLDELHPHLWRSGKQFPANAGAMRQQLLDGELLLSFTFNPNEVANEVSAGRMPDTVVSYQFDSGTIGNTHFVAIAFNSAAKEAAQVVANFLISPVAQSRKADLKIWGDPSVLAPSKLMASDAALFNAGRATGQVERFAPVIPEPHGSWVDPIEKEWARRYGA